MNWPFPLAFNIVPPKTAPSDSKAEKMGNAKEQIKYAKVGYNWPVLKMLKAFGRFLGLQAPLPVWAVPAAAWSRGLDEVISKILASYQRCVTLQPVVIAKLLPPGSLS